MHAKHEKRRQSLKHETIQEILIRRDKLSPEAASELIQEARNDLSRKLSRGEMPENICEEWFGLEPDYFFDLL